MHERQQGVMAFLIMTLSKDRTLVTIGIMKRDMETNKGLILIVDNEVVSWIVVV